MCTHPEKKNLPYAEVSRLVVNGGRRSVAAEAKIRVIPAMEPTVSTQDTKDYCSTGTLTI
jgi:hypothetical protein